MDLNEIKELIQKDGGKIIIVENDKPQVVVMSFEEYKANGRRTASSGPPPAPRPQPEQPFDAAQGKPAPVQMSPEPPRPQNGELSIDDLPL
ncbi:MAG TPA: hypothetical protein VFE94_00555 [Candidatus Paceibacterota bacterium]|nr:hypothetical protein [Candidatus Paceibacterota bacterium]